MVVFPYYHRRDNISGEAGTILVAENIRSTYPQKKRNQAGESKHQSSSGSMTCALLFVRSGGPAHEKYTTTVTGESCHLTVERIYFTAAFYNTHNKCSQKNRSKLTTLNFPSACPNANTDFIEN